VRARRLARQWIPARANDAVTVARDTCGIHAQVQASAELQLAVRVDGITQADVRRALWEERTLVKAWTLRGTLHLHAAEDAPLWFAAVRAASPGDPGELREWVDPQGERHPALTRDDVEEIRSAVVDVLGGRCLLREELVAGVVERVGTKGRSRLVSGFNFFGGADLCQGPPQGNKITLARPDRWIASWKDLDAETSLREVCRRFLRTYGPARPRDFREWFGFKPADELFESLGGELEEIDVAGHRSFVLAGDTDFPAPQPSVRLLPEYDVYVMGFRERAHLVPEPVREQIAQHGRGRYEGPAGVRFLLVDGVAAGLWERKKRGKRIELHVAPARRLTRAQRVELDGGVERIGAFLGLDPVLSYGP
jgi:DNA glycosylase AlkZ-like